MGYYKTAQICLNGHIITRDVSPSLSAKFCKRCGAETICKCLNCNAPIRGEYHVDGVLDLTANHSPAPAYCHNCGEPFPWTEDALEGIRMVIDEEDMLNNDEKGKLKKSLPDLISDNPKSSLAEFLFKKAISSVGKTAKEALVNFAVSNACAEVKKRLGL